MLMGLYPNPIPARPAGCERAAVRASEVIFLVLVLPCRRLGHIFSGRQGMPSFDLFVRLSLSLRLHLVLSFDWYPVRSFVSFRWMRCLNGVNVFSAVPRETHFPPWKLWTDRSSGGLSVCPMWVCLPTVGSAISGICYSLSNFSNISRMSIVERSFLPDADGAW